MGIGINSMNAVGMMANRHANIHQNAVSKALERLSSGLKINSAADDPSGLARVQRMRAQLAQIEKSESNMLDELSKAETADGVLAGIGDMMQRMNELATKAASGTYDEHDLEMMNEEYQALMDEIVRQQNTKFMDQNLFGSNGMKSIPDLNPPEGGKTGKIASGGNLNAYLDALNGFLEKISSAAAKNDKQALKALGLEVGRDVDLSNDENSSKLLREAVISFTEKNADKLLSSGGDSDSDTNYEIFIENGNIRVSGSFGGNGTREGAYGLGGTAINTQEGALAAMDALKLSINRVSSQRAGYGATMSRLEHAMSNLSTMQINLAESISRIADADMAKEMMNYTKEQILLQLSQFVMAQASGNSRDTLSFIQSMI